MFGSLAFFAWIVLFVAMALAVRNWRRPADSGRVLRFFAAVLAFAAIAAIILDPPDFGGMVLISLGLSLGGSAGAVLAERTTDARLPQAFAAARAAGAFGCLWIVAAALHAPASLGAAGGGHAVFLSLLLAAVFAAMAFAGLMVAALPTALCGQVRAAIGRMSSGIFVYGAGGLALLSFAYAGVDGGIGALWLSASLAGLAAGLHALLRPSAAVVVRSALLDGFSAVAVGMLGLAMADAMLIAVGGFAAAAALALSQRAGRRSF